MGWANHRANRLIDLAALTFCFYEASAITQGRRVECVALFWLHRSAGSLRRLRAKKSPEVWLSSEQF
jgi:hypothetical protein